MNARVRMSSKGQIVVPKSVREAHGWKEGTELELVESSTGVLVREVEEFDDRYPPIAVEQFLAGRIRIDQPFPSDKEIEEALLAEAARRFDAIGR